MSAPELPNGKISLTREQALNAIITSIAMEETALSQLINAEGEKIKYAIDYIKKNYDNHNLQKFLEVNESASSLLDTINAMQVLLKSKLHTALNHLPPSAGQNPSDSPCAAPGSRHARRPSKPAEAPIPVKPRPRSAHTAPNPPLPSVSAFPVVIEYAWSSGATLPLDEDRHGCGGGVKMLQNRLGYSIVLPMDKKFKIGISVELRNKNVSPVAIELEIDYGSKDTYTRLYEFPGTRQISLRDELLWAAPARCCNDSRLSLRLISPKLLRINGGEIRVVEIKDG